MNIFAYLIKLYYFNCNWFDLRLTANYYSTSSMITLVFSIQVSLFEIHFFYDGSVALIRKTSLLPEQPSSREEDDQLNRGAKKIKGEWEVEM